MTRPTPLRNSPIHTTADTIQASSESLLHYNTCRLRLNKPMRDRPTWRADGMPSNYSDQDTQSSFSRLHRSGLRDTDAHEREVTSTLPYWLVCERTSDT